jgi:endoglucanase
VVGGAAASGGNTTTGGSKGGTTRVGGTTSVGDTTSVGGTTASGGTPTAGTGFRGLTPKAIVKDMFLGWNLGNTFDSTSGGETGWGNPVTTQAMIDTVKSGGFKTVRIPVTWQSQLGAGPTYTINKTFLDRVETVVNYVLNDGMYAIVNTHHDGWYKLATASQAQGEAETTAVWGQIAARFKDYSDYLIFETFNEPHGTVNAYGGGNAEQQTVLNAYHLAAVNAIRATGGNNAQRIIMIATHGASPVEAAAKALVIPNNDPNCIISVHTYYPTGFGLNGSPTTWGASASEYTAMGASLDQILSWWPDRAIVIGEWGSVSKDDLASRVKHAKAYTQDATKRGMCPVWWDNGGGDFGLLNRRANPPSWTYPTIVAALKEGSTAGSAAGAVDATMP